MDFVQCHSTSITLVSEVDRWSVCVVYACMICECELCKTYTTEAAGISCSCFSCQETVHECCGSSVTPMSWLHTMTGHFLAGLWREGGLSIFVTSVSVVVAGSCR